MDLLKLPAVAPLPNNLKIMNGDVYEALYTHINQLTIAVNNLTEELSKANEKIKLQEKESAAISKNVTLLAEAMEEVLKDEDA